MNRQDIVFFDFETTSINPHTCQPTELAAVCIDGRRLTIREDSIFSSLIKPEFDEEKCSQLNLDPFTDEVSRKTGITSDMLKDAPTLEVVWSQFHTYHKKYNPSGSKWSAPIKAGFNITNYDNHIVNRICGGHFRHTKRQMEFLGKTKAFQDIKLPRVIEPYGFGPWDENRMEETLFAPRDCIDLMSILWMWTENLPEVTSLSMDATRDWLGISKEGAHRAAKDVIDGAKVLIKFLQLTRKISGKTKFKGAMSNEDV